jgi:predicted MFS family arabinose efflux permease
LSWRPVFLVNVPVGIAALVLARRLVPDTRSERTSRLDLRGAAILAVGLLGLLVPATMGRELGWPAWSIALLVLPPIATVGLVQHARRSEAAGHEPLLPLSLLGSPALRAGLGVSVALFLAAGGFFLTTALTLQEGLRFSPLVAGLTMMPFAVAFTIASLSGQRLVRRFGSSSIVLGGLVYALGMAVLAAEAWLGYASETAVTLAPGMILVGFGQGTVVAPLFGLALAGVPAERAGTASGLLTTTVQAALATGAAVLGLVFLAVLGQGGAGGYAQATASVCVLQAALGVGVALLARRLPAIAGRASESERTPKEALAA